MKKRILSLILALSMVLSVLPLGAFAEGSLPELVMENGLPDCSGGTSGNGWSYDNNTQTLTLTSHSGTYDFSSTHPQGKTPGTSTTTPVACAIVISSGVEGCGNYRWNLRGQCDKLEHYQRWYLPEHVQCEKQRHHQGQRHL